MTKSQFIEALAAQEGATKKDAEKWTAAITKAITDNITEGPIQLVGFGTFETRHRNARTGRNPQTKEAIQIPAQDVPAFKAGKALKDAVSAKKPAKKAAAKKK